MEKLLKKDKKVLLRLTSNRKQYLDFAIKNIESANNKSKSLHYFKSLVFKHKEEIEELDKIQEKLND